MSGFSTYLVFFLQFFECVVHLLRDVLDFFYVCLVIDDGADSDGFILAKGYLQTWVVHLRQHLVYCKRLVGYRAHIHLVLLNHRYFVVIKRRYEINGRWSLVLTIHNIQWYYYLVSLLTFGGWFKIESFQSVIFSCQRIFLHFSHFFLLFFSFQ